MAIIKRALFTFTLLAASVSAASPATCGTTRSVALCCQTSAPFYTNAYVWGSMCGVKPNNTNVLMGGRCEQVATSVW
jgi:hypothetical protein